MSLLIELNTALKKMDLPKHRKTVDKSGSNLAWLKKNAGRSNKLSPRLQAILSLDNNKIITGDSSELAE